MSKFEKIMIIVVWILLAITFMLDAVCFVCGYAASWDITFLMHIFAVIAWMLYTNATRRLSKVFDNEV